MIFKSPRKPDLLFRWLLWTLAMGLVLGGKPWKFPGGGSYWLRSVGKKQELK